MWTLEIISPDTIEAATELAKAAFSDDDRFRPLTVASGGPPGHDDPMVHGRWMRDSHYYACFLEGCLGGSIIIAVRGGARGIIHGMHVHPSVMNKGVGSWMLREIRRLYPAVKIWELETPDYAKRNHHFYEKNGFVRVSVTGPEPDLGFGFFQYRFVGQ
ncbi:GNAT family N-acetyltransferase [Modicisalibacter coralii]|uniref:GNAT family N-acetyltransferase n=1 Tax=Modicisalibacter coralii TaxID=2304602 RepID=UPI00100B1A00|nr:GNAT family N-acetyltransferase [Halomonas coralii]